jgi:phosphoadenosine phosphosulfate reductase
MSAEALKLCIPKPGQTWTETQLAAVSPCLEKKSAEERIEWALDYLPDQPVLTSSFGAQSAVMLHLLTRFRPSIPVVLIDTGYLFEETYRFIDRLVAMLDLDLRIYRPQLSPAWQEVRYGKLWEQGAEGIRRYNQMNKVEPMERALQELQVGTWFSGLRRSQSDTRSRLDVLQRQGEAVKVYPILDWNNRDIHRYLTYHGLPYHPLWEESYVSIGDHHSSRPLTDGLTEQETRFFGLVRECGLHEPERFGRSAQNSEVETSVATAGEAVADAGVIVHRLQ